MRLSRIVYVLLLACLMISCHSAPETTKCPDCDGTGYTDTVVCTDCCGTGEVECEDCDGSGLLEPCTRCGGDHEIPCSHCGETGINADGLPCSHCEGTGHEVCPSCYGAHEKCSCVHSRPFKPGWVLCRTCDGLREVYIECKTCNGSGRI